MQTGMSKVLVIIKREYLFRVRSRAFIISTIATPLFLLGVSALPIILAARGGAERDVTVLDQSGEPGLFEIIKRRTDSIKDEANFKFTQVVVPAGSDVDELRKEYNERIKKNKNEAYLVLRRGIITGVSPEYYAESSGLGMQRLERAISAALTEHRLVTAGLDEKKATDLMKPVDLKTIKVGQEGETEDNGMAFIVGLVMLIFIYATILAYGMSVMRGVIEEKQSRIAEIIVSSVKPFQMMMGKLIGIGLVGLTQYAIWAGSAGVLMRFISSQTATSEIKLPPLPPLLLFYFVAFFVLGYFLFATLYTIVGAIVSTEEEAQQVQFPVTMLVILPMTIFFIIIKDPNGPLSLALSLIPFFAPTLMMMRIAMVSPPVWQVLLSMGLMLLTIVAFVWLAAKVYRVGILMYGKRPNLAELGRWIRYST